MIILYTRAGCGYCERVKSFMKAQQLPWTERDLSDAAVGEELLARGGKKQVPYMIDTERGTEMYESMDIINYLHTTYVPDSTVGEFEEVRTCPIF